jgi:hypothetical protein
MQAARRAGKRMHTPPLWLLCSRDRSARRVKCDETRPLCERCTKSGRACGGYKPPPRVHLHTICPRPPTLVLAKPLKDLESIALDFFRLATIHQLPCASATETPWEHVALDLVYQQPSIAAAVSACAALHRAETDVKDGGQREFALQQYNKSLALLREYIDKLRPQTTDDDNLVVLVACLLFFSYETFSGRDAKAALHLRTGLRIIHEKRCPKDEPLRPNDRHVVVVNSDPKGLFDTLVQTFIRLDSDYPLTGHDDP